MAIGTAIFLLAVGFILAVAVDIDPTPFAGLTVEWPTVGWILVVVGILGIILSIATRGRRSHRSTLVDRGGNVVGEQDTRDVQDLR